MKKFFALFFVLVSFLVASAAYASSTVIINNELAAKYSNEAPVINAFYKIKAPNSPIYISAFYNLPKGDNVISDQIPIFRNFLKASIYNITGFYIGKSGREHDFVTSPSCKKIKLIPDIANYIYVTSGTVTWYGVKTPAAICTVSYGEYE